MSESNQERLAKLKLLLAQEKAQDNNQKYIEDLERSIARLEQLLQYSNDARVFYQMVS